MCPGRYLMTPQDVVSLKNSRNSTSINYQHNINNLNFVLLHTKACFHIDSVGHWESWQTNILEKIVLKKELGNIPIWNIPD